MRVVSRRRIGAEVGGVFIGIVAAAACGAVLALGGCESPPAEPRAVQPAIVRDVPAIFRGTIGSEATLNGIEPALVSGYGLVVGLNGTGGQPLPDAIAATMEREMGLRGVSKSADLGPNSPFSGKTPREVLRDPNVAVVVVTAAIAPGLPEGARFDVYVKAVNASSLEGGRLFSTEMRLGPANPFGRVQARTIASARGPVFVNPFSEPGKEDTGVNAQVGRVLNGGLVTEPLTLDLVMDQASHGRARSIVSAINSRFPEGRGDRGPVARGLSGGSLTTGDGGRISVRIPSAYRNTPAEFVKILRGVQIDPAFPEEYARQYVAKMQAEPVLADDLSYCLEALGPKAVPFVRELYDHAETVPQLAALRAGVGLEDARAAQYLKDLAVKGPDAVRTEAVRLLGDAKAGPTVDVALQQLLSEGQLTVRIAAYEALARRAERAQFARLVERQLTSPDLKGSSVSVSQLEDAATMWLPPGTIQGVTRLDVRDKFTLDLVPFGDPMVYITQQGRPRIVLFGENPELVKPLLVSAWSDRFTIVANSEADKPRVQFKPIGSARAITMDAPEDLKSLVQVLARRASPEDPRPGLDMNYSEVVGVLYALNKDGATNATFATERDRLLAELLNAAQADQVKERPETTKDREELVVFDRPAIKAPATDDGKKKPAVRPIEPKPVEKK